MTPLEPDPEPAPRSPRTGLEWPQYLKGAERPAGPAPEDRAAIEDAVRKILARLGEDPAREGLEKTPRRVAESLEFLTSGYAEDVDALVGGAIYHEDVDEMVVVKDMELYSLCEHHLLPMFGKCHVAYLPRGRIIGLSKVPRIVDAFARRLQVQERLTVQIARAIERHLTPVGVGVIVEASHLCMMMRGVEKQNSKAVTSCMLGRFRSDDKTRAEFLNLIRQRA
jgi:GTP cyclohydrolase I